MSPNLILAIYVFMFLASLVVDVFFERIYFLITKSHYKEHHFTLSRYLMSLLVPFVVILVLVLHLGYTYLNVFISAAIFGTILEWLVGWWFHQIMGTRLWTYHRYSITRYTSFLSIPIWGIAGVFMSLIVKIASS